MTKTRIIVSTNALVACGTSSPKSVLAYTAPSGIQATVTRFGVSEDGTSSTDARAQVDFLKGLSAAGTRTDISSEIQKLEGGGTSFGNGYQNYSAEPTGVGQPIRPALVPPTGPLESSINAVLAPSETLVLRVKANGKNCLAWMEIELG